MRGTLHELIYALPRDRFIPACAGNSAGWLDQEAAANRFIPACAGNSGAVHRCSTERPVHPRVCGELVLQGFDGLAPTGSSPRVRGTRLRCRPPAAQRRFIPACAGNSRLGERLDAVVHGSSPRVRGTRPSTPCRRTSTPVHPRVCGELDQFPASAHPACRFIPACAGNSVKRRVCL